jgi:hypothetical protein
MKFFSEKADLSNELEQIQKIKEDFSNLGFFGRLAVCFHVPKL